MTSLVLGLRHGVDWDHIAAIADLSGTADTRRRGFLLSMLYALGHAAVVFALGSLAIAFGFVIPDGADQWMSKIVGVTLVLLGAWILIELLRKGRDFRLRSRWMLMIDGTFAGLRRVRNAATSRTIQVHHEHEHQHSEAVAINPSPDHDSAAAASQAHDHAHVAAEPALQAALVPAGRRLRTARQRLAEGHRHSHIHRHTHELALPTNAGARYGNGTAAGIGVLHGIGVESPTQIAIFVASTSTVGVGFGFGLLAAWVLGLLAANAIVAVLAGAGLLHAERSFPIYATLAVAVSVMSIALGTLYIIGLDILPSILT